MTWGDVLLDSVAKSQRRVLLVAPFIKSHVMRRLLSSMNAAAALDVYTRWRPEEVASGVSDLDVLDVVKGRPNSSLWLCNRLHAKYYRCDDLVLVGSANLTGKGLGWAQNHNLEFLLSSAWTSTAFGEFERELMSLAVPATQELRKIVELAAASLPRPALPAADLTIGGDESVTPSVWLPVTRHPESLYQAYCGRLADLSTAAAEQTVVDLARVPTAAGLTAEAFHAAVRVALLQNPAVVAVEEFGAQPRRFGEVRAFLGERLAVAEIERDPTEAWQTLLRWLLYFFPDRYRVESSNYSEVFSVRSPER